MSIVDQLFGSQVTGLSKMLDLSWRRHKVITSNIANAETPQYRAVDLHFGSELERAFDQYQGVTARTSPQHLEVSTESVAHLLPDLTGATKPDGNNVDLDIQMGQLSYNSGKYSQASGILRRKFERISSIIRTVA